VEYRETVKINGFDLHLSQRMDDFTNTTLTAYMLDVSASDWLVNGPSGILQLCTISPSVR